MTRRNAFRAPGFRNLDIGFYKTFRLTERYSLQLRSEFYNVFNHASFQNVDTVARFDAAGKQVNGTFGQYTSTLDARRLVLGAKIYF